MSKSLPKFKLSLCCFLILGGVGVVQHEFGVCGGGPPGEGFEIYIAWAHGSVSPGLVCRRNFEFLYILHTDVC